RATERRAAGSTYGGPPPAARASRRHQSAIHGSSIAACSADAMGGSNPQLERTVTAAPGYATGRAGLASGVRGLRGLPAGHRHRQVSSLAELTSIPRSTVHRLLVQLRRSRAVELRADGRWVVSPQLVEITGRAGPLDGVRTGTNRVLQALRAQTGATVSLVVAT